MYRINLDITFTDRHSAEAGPCVVGDVLVDMFNQGLVASWSVTRQEWTDERPNAPTAGSWVLHKDGD